MAAQYYIILQYVITLLNTDNNILCPEFVIAIIGNGVELKQRHVAFCFKIQYIHLAKTVILMVPEHKQ